MCCLLCCLVFFARRTPERAEVTSLGSHHGTAGPRHQGRTEGFYLKEGRRGAGSSTKCPWRLSSAERGNQQGPLQLRRRRRRACDPKGRTSTVRSRAQEADRSRARWRGWRRTRLNTSRVRWLCPNSCQPGLRNLR